MEKSPEAFRTISEVADLLDTPAHVLRFWESRFPQIRPVKRAGGRRYYRPGDVSLLAGIKKLLHDDGLTIRGVQKILREQGIRHVSGLAAPLPDPVPGSEVVIDAEDASADEAQFLLSALAPASTPTETAQIIPLEQAFARHEAQRGAPAFDEDDRADDPAAETLDAPEAPFIEAEEEIEPVETLPLFGRIAEPPPDGRVDATAVEEAPVTENLFAGDDMRGESPSEALPDGAEDEAAAEETDASAAAPMAEPEMPADPTVAARLRRSRRARLAPHRAELERLYDRLADLRDRVAEASRRRIR